MVLVQKTETTNSVLWLARFDQRILPLNQSLHDVSIYCLLKALESRVRLHETGTKSNRNKIEIVMRPVWKSNTWDRYENLQNFQFIPLARQFYRWLLLACVDVLFQCHARSQLRDRSEMYLCLLTFIPESEFMPVWSRQSAWSSRRNELRPVCVIFVPVSCLTSIINNTMTETKWSRFDFVPVSCYKRGLSYNVRFGTFLTLVIIELGAISIFSRWDNEFRFLHYISKFCYWSMNAMRVYKTLKQCIKHVSQLLQCFQALMT